ncbi:hypothetical protein TCAL_11862, partial [Tigriopus californicus]|eukprot:TCALIF_11862-PA protein Name:"Protein of unknown function" AED:0.14 eAED:0.16 QI:10/0/0/1/0/0/3/0/301
MIADALSRAPLFDPPESDDVAITDIQQISASPPLPGLIKFSTISEVAKTDPNYCAVVQALQNGLGKKELPLGHPARLYSNVWDELLLDNEFQVLLYHQRVSLHMQHQGITKTRELARQLYYWPGLMNAISSLISNCPECLHLLPSQPREPMTQAKVSKPFEAISVDLFEVKGLHYVTMVNRYSSWTCVALLRKRDTTSVTKVLDAWPLKPSIVENARKYVNNTNERTRNRYNLRTRYLPPLQTNSKVLVQNPRTRRWDSTGIIMNKRANGHSYKVEINGTCQPRNRIFLKPLPQKRVRFKM